MGQKKAVQARLSLHLSNCHIPFLTERLLMGSKESTQTNKQNCHLVGDHMSLVNFTKRYEYNSSA